MILEILAVNAAILNGIVIYFVISTAIENLLVRKRERRLGLKCR
ncbi:MAG: hypothetical protein ACM3VV_06725 [Deltaproteobacteria bacterium]|jgi:hypothetical protein